MKGEYWLLSTVIGVAGWGAILSAPSPAQVPPSERCLAELESCAYQDYPQYNQQVNFRTPTQIQQRKFNAIENQCGASNSPPCNSIVPQVEAIQENPTLQQLRDQQIRTLETPSAVGRLRGF
jgi:hypothetical protein